MKEEQTAAQAVIPLPASKEGDDELNPLKLEIPGLNVLERTLWALEKAGVQKVHFLPNGQAEHLEQFLDRHRNWKLETKIHYGTSVSSIFEEIDAMLGC